jgi:uncharacterized HAD superfamily protein/hypoxanthine phosphoribosyltransferase
MNYRSINDLSSTVRNSLHLIPSDVDLVVGIPRSGMLVATIIAMNMNIRFCDIQGFLNNLQLITGNTRRSQKSNILYPADAKRVLIVDDSVGSGHSIQRIKDQIRENNLNQEIIYLAAYVDVHTKELVDCYFEIVRFPRVFEWNVMHRELLAQCCLDIDGVLCIDPTNEQNDDASAYKKFLLNATPLIIPSYFIGHLVTSRLEKYRQETEIWLTRMGVSYGQLHMLDLPDAKTRQRLNSHASFKADIYMKQTNSILFIESEIEQAKSISNLAGKYVLCFSNQMMYSPNMSYAMVKEKTNNIIKRILAKIYRETAKALKK